MSFRMWVEVVVEGESWEAKSRKMRAGSRDWTSAELQRLPHACLLPVQPGFMPQMTLGFLGQLGFFHFLCPLTTSTTMAPWWINKTPGFPSVLAPGELVHLCSCFVCVKEKREGFHIWISSNYCVSQVKLALFFLSSFSAKFKKGQPCLVSWKLGVIIKWNGL